MSLYQERDHSGGRSENRGGRGRRGRPRRSSEERAGKKAKAESALRSFLVRKDGHVFTFVYPPEHELAALKALADCPKLDPADVIALVCYLGHDPRELGEELF